jgi:hypothetical protein
MAATHGIGRRCSESVDCQRFCSQPLVIDLDATLVTAHSDKENAAPNCKRGFGFYPLYAFADHCRVGSGEPLAIMLGSGNAGSNTAADHKQVVEDTLAQLPFQRATGGRTQGTDPRRHSGRNPRIARLPAQTAPVVLARVLHLRGSRGSDRPASRVSVDTGLRRRRCDQRRRLGRRDNRIARLDRLARGMRLMVRREQPHPGGTSPVHRL